jgi:hypothetical protein
MNEPGLVPIVVTDQPSDHSCRAGVRLALWQRCPEVRLRCDFHERDAEVRKNGRLKDRRGSPEHDHGGPPNQSDEGGQFAVSSADRGHLGISSTHIGEYQNLRVCSPAV